MINTRRKRSTQSKRYMDRTKEGESQGVSKEYENVHSNEGIHEAYQSVLKTQLKRRDSQGIPKEKYQRNFTTQFKRKDSRGVVEHCK